MHTGLPDSFRPHTFFMLPLPLIEDFFWILRRGGNKMLTYCHVSVGLDVANIAINLVRRFDFNVTLMGFLS